MAPKFNASEDLSDLTGKVVLITGATSGLGYPVAQELLRKGATVYLAARSESKAVATISRLEAEGLGPGNGKSIWHKLELDNPHDVKKSAEEFLSRESRLDILINNAACLGREYALGPIGVQDIVTINHISPFLFTKLLLPLLRKTAQETDSNVRIVNVASDAHRFITKAQFKDKADFNGPSTSDDYWAQLQRYGYSKLLDILWTKELARQLALSPDDGGVNVLCLTLHPGSIATEGAYSRVARLPWPFSTLLRWITTLTRITSAEAAGTMLIAAAQPGLRKEKEKYQAAYLVPIGKLGKISEIAADEGLQKDLWILTEKPWPMKDCRPTYPRLHRVFHSCSSSLSLTTLILFYCDIKCRMLSNPFF